MIELEHLRANLTKVILPRGTLYFSYSTCVAAVLWRDDLERLRIRRERNYSRTTARHLTEVGAADWTKVPDEDFEDLVGQIV